MKAKYTIIRPASKEKLIKELETIGVKLRDNGRAIVSDGNRANVELFNDRAEIDFGLNAGCLFMAYRECYIKTDRGHVVWLTVTGKKSTFIMFITHPKDTPCDK